jgi:hypothetical protein
LSSKQYKAKLGENNFFLLKHSTGHYPKNSEVDVPIIYADYYFLEANLRRLKLSGNWEGDKAAVIIKADDLVYDKGTSVPEAWKRFAEIALEKNCKVAPGIVGSSLESGDAIFFNWIKKKQKTGLFEFGNHGQLHKRWEKDGKRQSELAIQGHPLSWDNYGFDQYEMMIDYLQEIGVPIILPLDLI